MMRRLRGPTHGLQDYSHARRAKTPPPKSEAGLSEDGAQVHPDVNPGVKSAEGRFKEINEAYEVIGDPDKRKKYDELGSNWQMYEQAQRGGGGAGAGTGAQGSYRTMTPDEMRDLFGNEDPFSDFFHAFFSGGGEPQMRGRGGRAGSRAQGPRKGRDVEHALDLSLEDAYKGTTRRLSMKHDGQSRNVTWNSPRVVEVRASASRGQASKGRRRTSGILYPAST